MAGLGLAWQGATGQSRQYKAWSARQGMRRRVKAWIGRQGSAGQSVARRGATGPVQAVQGVERTPGECLVDEAGGNVARFRSRSVSYYDENNLR